ncbi:XdhC family protein [Pelagibacterium mangrovi]|uniref:XdhC family protein n=1 Tax=Pelagibacterium mangrovi TaxID=3119828 RepID=UPI003F7E84CA
MRRFAPRTRALLIGRGQELEATARTAHAAGLDLHVASPSSESLAILASLRIPTLALTSPEQNWALPIDRWTATVLLFHDHDWELRVLQKALAADGFYIGALGSPKTHRQRREKLLAVYPSGRAIQTAGTRPVPAHGWREIRHQPTASLPSAEAIGTSLVCLLFGNGEIGPNGGVSGSIGKAGRFLRPFMDHVSNGVANGRSAFRQTPRKADASRNASPAPAGWPAGQITHSVKVNPWQ